MPFTPQILAATSANGDRIRSYLGTELGITSVDFPDEAIFHESMLGEAEAEIIDLLGGQPQGTGGVPTLTQILSGTLPATARDKTNLENAVIYYVAALFCNGATNAIDVSITDRNQTKDRGGIGTQWKDERENAFEDAERALRRIKNWKAFLVLPPSS